MTKALRLRDRLFLLVLVCVLPLALVALVQQYTWYTEKRNAEYDRLLSISRSLAVSIEHDQQTRTTALRTLANARSLRSGDFDTFRASADDFLQHQPLGASLGVVDDLGRDVVSVTRNPNAAGIQREQPYLAPSATVQRVFESGSAVVSSFHPGSVDGRPGYRIDVPVIVDGRVAYVLFLELPSDSLTDLLSRQHLPDHAVAAFLDPQGIVVARVPDAEQFVGQRAVPALVARLQSGQGGLMEIPTLEGTPAFAAVSLVPSTGWAVGVGVPRRVVLQPVWRDVAMSLGISGLVLVVALGLASLVARRITEPMATLRRSALAPPAGGAVATGLPEADEVSAALTAAEQSRRTAAADLAEVEHRLELARDGANLGVWDWNARTGVLTWDRREWILHGLEPRETGPTYAMWRSI
ncbi:MAG: cache domain-containing protein, partial [Acetobacteraceae bacterium]